MNPLSPLLLVASLLMGIVVGSLATDRQVVHIRPIIRCEGILEGEPEEGDMEFPEFDLENQRNLEVKR